MSAAAPHNPPTFDEKYPHLFTRFVKAQKSKHKWALPRFFGNLTTDELRAFVDEYLVKCDGPRAHAVPDGSYDHTFWHYIAPEMRLRLL